MRTVYPGVDGGGSGEMESIRAMQSQQKAQAMRNSVPQSLTHGVAEESAQIQCLSVPLLEVSM